MSDRSFGYAVLLFLAIFLFFPLYYLAQGLYCPGQRITVVFVTANTLNFLKVQDPVRVKGLVVGQVKSISLNNGTNRVSIEVKPHIVLHRGCGATAVPVGFMGDRCLDIDPGDPEAPPAKASEPVMGQFLPGPAEAIGKAGKLRDKLEAISAAVHDLRFGTPAEPPLPVRFRKTVGALDRISASLATLLRRADVSLGSAMDSLSGFMKKSSRYSGTAAAAVPDAESQYERLLGRSATILKTTDSLLDLMNRNINQLSQSDSSGAYEKLRALDKELGSLVLFFNAVEQDGLKTRIRL